MTRSALMATLLLLGTLALLAEEPRPPEDPLARFVYPPELIMGHAEELGLSEGQRNAIKTEVTRAQSHFIELEWDLREETQRLAKLIQQSPADEARVLAQADRVMSLEREIKKTHLGLLVRLKNLLTSEQRARLDEERRAAR